MSDVCSCTDEDEAQTDGEGEQVASERLVVLAIAFGKHSQVRVNVILTQRLHTGKTLHNLI